MPATCYTPALEARLRSARHVRIERPDPCRSAAWVLRIDDEFVRDQRRPDGLKRWYSLEGLFSEIARALDIPFEEIGLQIVHCERRCAVPQRPEIDADLLGGEWDLPESAVISAEELRYGD